MKKAVIILLIVCIFPAWLWIAPEQTEAKSYTYLFIGNSMTYYNNLPEMYAELAEAATNDTISWQNLTYGGRKLDQHAAAIRAVIRTKGNSAKLTYNERAYFGIGGVNSNNFSQAVFNKYKKAILKSDGSVKHYDYIYMQEYGQLENYSRTKNGVFSILKDLSYSDTNVMVSMAYYQLTGSVSTLCNLQAGQDARLEKLVEAIDKSSIPHKSAKVVHTGRAACNYYLYNGKRYAMNNSAADYNKYGGGAMNDITIRSGYHPTQLGTYMFASLIYSCVYGRDAYADAPNFKAKVSANCLNLKSMSSGANYATGAMHSKASLKYTSRVAYDTQNNDVIYGSSNGWKKEYGMWFYYSGKQRAVGWKQISGKWYFFNARGFVTGWKKIEGKWYYFHPGGSMVTGWKKIEGKWYYFHSEGYMVKEWKRIKGKWYYFGKEGELTTGWKVLKGKKYYFNSDGVMLTGTQKIGGRTYVFDKEGALVR